MYNAKIGTAYLPSTPPPGSVMAFLGTIEPDGWIIANGNQRTNGSDGRYDNLIALQIGSSTGSSYTPPDLKGAFLRGAGTPNNSNYLTYQGSTTVGGIQSDQNKPHNHNINRAKFRHGHTYGDVGVNTGTHQLVYDANVQSKQNFNIITSQTYDLQRNVADAFVAQEFVTTELSSDSGETRPYNYSVNWIIKL